MHFIELHQKLQAAYQAAAAPEPAWDEQEECVNDLFLFLDTQRGALFPELLVHQVIRICQWYLDHLLPAQGYELEDQQAIATDYADLFAYLRDVVRRSNDIEQQLIGVIGGLRTGAFGHEWEAAESLSKMVHRHLDEDPNASLRCVSTFRRKIRAPFNRSQIMTFTARFFGALEEGYRASPQRFHALANIEELCDFTLHAYFQGKAVLVNTVRQGIIMPLWVTVAAGQKSEEVEFENPAVDETMRAAANAARKAAGRYLRSIYDREFDEQTAVRCQFPLPWVGYRDASAGLLLALRIVGEVLDLDPQPATVATGEVDAAGKLLKVGWIAEKLHAACDDERITRIIAPQANLVNVDSRGFPGLEMLPARSLSEALEQYYGEALQQQLRRLSRRQILKSAIGLIAAPLLFFSAKDFAPAASSVLPVAECDYRLLECARDLYQQKSEYASAVTILESLVTRFPEAVSSAEARQLKAYAFGQLGVIHLQQHRVQDSLQVFERAAQLWESLRDRENQADVFFRIGDAYRDMVAMDGASQYSASGLRCYRQAYDLLNPSMPLYSRLHAKYYALTGFMHYWLGEYEIAEQLGRKALTIFEEPDTNWTYQTARQHLGRALIKTGKYDEAHDILQSTAQTSTLQGPHDRARNTLALAELYFAVREPEKALQYADAVNALCEQYGIHSQQRDLRKLLAQHNRA